MENYAAIIVGFGPTGATLANLLGGMGMRVAVIERETAIYDKPRAITADHEALRVFQAIGLADEIAANTCPHPGTDFVGIDGEVIKQFYPLASPGPLGWEPTFMFYQPALEASLRNGVARYPQVEVFPGHTLTDVRQDDRGVTVQMLTPEGETRTLSADTLLACDGARSQVRSHTSLTLHDLAFDEWWVVVDANLKADITLPGRCVQYCRPSRPGTYIVGPNALRRWEIKVLPGEDPQAFHDPAHLEAVLATFVDTSGVDVQRVAIYRFHAVVAERWREGRIFLLGDAAHQMPPFLGQGMCAGIRDAWNLAWKLKAVRDGRAPDSLLDTYGEERRRHVQTVVSHAKSFGLIIGELDMEAARLRDETLGAQLRAGTAPTVRQSFIPGLSGGLIDLAGGKPAGGAGELFPQPWVSGRATPRTRLDELVREDFYLLCLDSTLAAGARQQLARYPQLAGMTVISLSGPPTAGVLALEEEGGFIHRWLTLSGGQAALVRPDGYAFGSASGVEGVGGLLARLAARLESGPTTAPVSHVSQPANIP